MTPSCAPKIKLVELSSVGRDGLKSRQEKLNSGVMVVTQPVKNDHEAGDVMGTMRLRELVVGSAELFGEGD